MNRRTARLLRAGILAARDPELRQYVHLAPRLVREACRREMENIEWREVLKCRELRDRSTASLAPQIEQSDKARPSNSQRKEASPMTAKTYRKKPVEIEAAQLNGGNGRIMQVAEWAVDNGYPWLVGNALEPETLRERGHEADEDAPTAGLWINPADGALMIRTLEGDMKASLGDFIIKGVQGEFYPCKPDIFAKTYEAVTE